MKTILPAFLMLMLSLSANGQIKRYTYYFDASLAPAQKEKAFIYGKGVKQDSAVWVDFFLIPNDQKIFSASYTDSSLNILHGKSIDYHKNGRVQLVKRYRYNVQDGLTQKWDDRGRQTDSILYTGGAAVFKKQFRYFKENTVLNEIITDSILNTLEDISYDTTGRKIRAVIFSGNTGVEKIYHPDGTVTNGDSLYTREDKDASFPGGPKAWASYLTRTLDGSRPVRAGAPEGQYKVVVQFIVNKDGTLLDIKALSTNGYGMEDEALRVIRNSGKWNPAMQYGRLVKAYRRQPITFSISKGTLTSDRNILQPSRRSSQAPSIW
ncbi:energy transducer TonB [Niabella pedocola]|uniref:Energy transducer TonB n=1 Tax=Niabella pedocola TaxID=1752077 RepID=A0ABS8PV88_9BACT|nr:energy transducer TonB [Niabella pedocola]MCD2424992.1 energy transducer TonB [Niabella pedocola]